MKTKNNLDAITRSQNLIIALDDVIWSFIDREFNNHKKINRKDGYPKAHKELTEYANSQSYLSKGVRFFTRGYPYHRRHDLIQLEAYRVSLEEALSNINKHLKTVKDAVQSGKVLSQETIKKWKKKTNKQAKNLAEKLRYILKQLEWQATNTSDGNKPGVELALLEVESADFVIENEVDFKATRRLRGFDSHSDLAEKIQEKIFNNNAINTVDIAQKITPCLKEKLQDLIQNHQRREQQRSSDIRPHLSSNTKLRSDLQAKQREEESLQARLIELHKEKQDIEASLENATDRIQEITLERDAAIFENDGNDHTQSESPRW